MKHVQRRHFFVRDMVESHEIEVPFVRTHDNISDFLTKPMANAAAFFYMRAVVMNEKRARDATPKLSTKRLRRATPSCTPRPT